jgi:hypothetical protein
MHGDQSDLLKPNEYKSFKIKMKEWLPFELTDRPLLLGSCHFILMNPLFSEVHQRLDSAKPSQLNVLLKANPKADLKTLKAIIHEIRPNGIAQSFEITPVQTLFSIDFGYEPHEVSLEIVCSQRGVLYISEPATFIHSIHIEMGLITGTKKVFVPANSLGKAPESYSIPMIKPGEGSVVGNSLPVQSALLSVIRDLSDYKQRKDAESSQRWFNDVNDAKMAIREIIGRAVKEVLIVDPYFGVRELQSFALATTSTKAEIKILSSAAFLKEKNNGQTKESGEHLAKQFKSLASQKIPNKIEIRVMPGKKPDIHDRFLGIDGQIWLLGSSLNEFGSRGTMMVKLQHPESIQSKLQEVWNISFQLEVFIAGRGKKDA